MYMVKWRGVQEKHAPRGIIVVTGLQEISLLSNYVANVIPFLDIQFNDSIKSNAIGIIIAALK